MEIIAKQPNLDLERMAEIALLSKAAGEALPEIEAAARGMTVPYKYGMHLANWFNGDSPGLRREVEATLPVSITFLDNVKGEGLNPQVEILHSRGVKPFLIYRPYFIPNNGANPAIVEGYANGAVIKMREDYFRYPLIRQAYDEGRFIVKLFNETNIGGEGFARGRAGFAPALHYWKQARGVVKAAYPNAKILSLCNTPGNDDVWFTGDARNQPYWYHGPEAAKANPTQADITAAIASCPFREMFQLCDYIGIHVYANIRSTVDGDLQTWYSRRHEQALKFLTPYIQQGKKMIINEWDLGYDEGKAYRAEAVVYGLNQIVGLNDAILCVNHWWNADKNEGAFTWDKHRTREDGTLLPVVHAVKAFREGAVPSPQGIRMIDLPSNHYSSRQGQRAKYVILHSTATPVGGSLESTATYLKQNDRGVSIHELVGTNTVYRMVADDKAAHHCESETARLPGGEPNYLNNELTWGIEAFQIADNPVAPDVARLLLERTVEACRRLQIPSSRVLAHREIDPTRRTDPVGINITQFRAAVAVALGEGQAPPDSLPFLRVVKERQEIANNPATAFMRAARGMGYYNSLGDEVYGSIGGRATVGQLFANTAGEERIFWAYAGDWSNVQHAPVPTQGAA